MTLKVGDRVEILVGLYQGKEATVIYVPDDCCRHGLILVRKDLEYGSIPVHYSREYLKSIPAES